jgi:hypothetical protein
MNLATSSSSNGRTVTVWKPAPSARLAKQCGRVVSRQRLPSDPRCASTLSASITSIKRRRVAWSAISSRPSNRMRQRPLVIASRISDCGVPANRASWAMKLLASAAR